MTKVQIFEKISGVVFVALSEKFPDLFDICHEQSGSILTLLSGDGGYLLDAG